VIAAREREERPFGIVELQLAIRAEQPFLRRQRSSDGLRLEVAEVEIIRVDHRRPGARELREVLGVEIAADEAAHSELAFTYRARIERQREIVVDRRARRLALVGRARRDPL